jgi:hypothetical protein
LQRSSVHPTLKLDESEETRASRIAWEAELDADPGFEKPPPEEWLEKNNTEKLRLSSPMGEFDSDSEDSEKKAKDSDDVEIGSLNGLQTGMLGD